MIILFFQAEDGIRNSPRKVIKKTSPKEKKSYDTRKGFPVELAAAYTTYKGIGATHDKTILMMKDLYEKPGCFYVGITRVREPKDIYIPLSEFPSALDVRCQRLQRVVMECENLERHVRVTCALLEVSRNLSEEQKDMAKIITDCWRKFVKDPVEMIADRQLDCDAFLNVLSQLRETDAKLLLEPTPMLCDYERNMLIDYKKPAKTKRPKRPESGTNGKRTRTQSGSTNMPPPKKKPPTKITPQPSVVPAPTIVPPPTVVRAPPIVTAPAQVIPHFKNEGKNACWLNSMMHIILMMYKGQAQNNVVVHGNESSFWTCVQEIINNYATCFTDFYRPRIQVGNNSWSLRRLVATMTMSVQATS